MWRYLACCFDKRVLIGLGVVLAGVLVVAPHQAVAALPVLVALVCPLSMLLMMRQRDGDRGAGQDRSSPLQGAAGSDAAPGAGGIFAGGAAELARLQEEVASLRAAHDRRSRERAGSVSVVKSAAQDGSGEHRVEERRDVTG